MTDNKIEEHLAEAVRKNTPDILDDLLADIARAEEPITAAGGDQNAGGDRDEVWKEVRAGKATGSAVPGQTGRSERSGHSGGRSPIRAIMSVAAVFVLLIGGFTVFSRMQQTFAVVGIDVNPSIELSINSREKVTEARAVNEEGEEILSDLNLTGTDAKTACYAITGAMLANGYLTNTSNSILVSVKADDPDKGRAIERKLAEDLNAYLGDSEIDASILGQYVEGDEELEAFAEANGISEGKAWLIRNLLASGSTNMTEENLLKLSTQELILLGQERNVQAESTYGSSDTSKYLGKDKAVEVALSNAGISKSQASGIRAEYDSENGIIIYEVEFTSGGIEYEYDIDASNGNIISCEKEKADKGHDDDRDDGHDDDRDDGHDDDRDDGHDDDHDSDDDHDDHDHDDDHDDHDHDHDDHDDHDDD